LATHIYANTHPQNSSLIKINKGFWSSPESCVRQTTPLRAYRVKPNVHRKENKLISRPPLKQLKSIILVVATTLMALAAISIVTACSPKPSPEESAAQTKVLVDQAVAEAKKQMIAEKEKQDAIASAQAQAEEKAKQDAAVAQAVANAKKEFAAEQRAKNAKKERRAKQIESATAAKSNNYSSNKTLENASMCTHCGVVLSVNEIDVEGKGSGLGVVAGGVVGGVLGHQVGEGTGRDLATIAGAVGGAFVGNKIEKSAKKTKSYSIVVKMDTGEERTFNQATVPYVVSGDKVKIENGVIVKR